MIKRLFRKRLRLRLAEFFGVSNPYFEEYFKWIYQYYPWNWQERFFCIRESYKFWEEQKYPLNPNWKEGADRLYTFLSK